MTARFAGSRSIDERRRRRLSQESIEEAPAPEAPTRRRRSPAGKSAEAQKAADEPLPIPDESLVPRSHWKITILAVCGLCVWGMVLWLGLARWPEEVGLGAAFGLRTGRLASFFSTACLFVAAQFSVAILWYRSRCRKDFMGRYRVWAWIAALWLVLSLCNATGIHVPITRLLIDSYPIGCWRPEVLYWLAPTAVGVLACHQLLLREVRQSRASFWFMNGSFALGCLAGIAQLAGDLWIEEPALHAVTTAAAMLWHLSIAVATLVHARFVVHVTNEAPPKRLNPTRRITGRFGTFAAAVVRRSRSLMSRFRKPKDNDEEDSSEIPKRRPRRKRPGTKSTSRSGGRTSVKRSVKETDPTVSEEQVEVSARVTSATPAPPAVKTLAQNSGDAPSRHLRTDPPAPLPAPHRPVSPAVPEDRWEEFTADGDDDGEDDGFGSLSKKERRRLKKLRQRSRD